MKIAIGNDHAAIGLKKDILAHLQSKAGIEVTDLGVQENESADYPKQAEIVASKVVSGEYDKGILLCGTGAGICMSANKVRGIRAVVCSEAYTAKLSRQHNDANVLCMGARVVGSELAKSIADAFLETEFEGGRHQLRVDMIMAIEGAVQQ